MKAMGPKRAQGKWKSLVYMDPLCGSGRCVDRESRVEFDGSPLLAVKTQPEFDRLYFNDLTRRNIAALRKRIPSEDLPRTDYDSIDCNAFVKKVVALVSGQTLGLAFLDPQGFEVKFETLRMLATKRIDILYLFPTGIGIKRNLKAFAQMHQSPMDSLWGDRDWRDLPPAKIAAGTRITAAEALTFEMPWVMAFRAKLLKLGFVYQDEGDPIFSNEKNVPMYHLLFFSKDSAGLTLWRGIKRIEPSGQRSLPI
jgi:three-Cys-motif partner protein